MNVTSHIETTRDETQVHLAVNVNRHIYGAMNKAVFKTTDKTLREVFEQTLVRELKKAHDTLKSVQAL